MNLLIKNVDAVTLDPQGTVLYGVDIAIAGKTILAVGAAPADFAPDEVIDGDRHVAVPGFFNAHCHAGMTLVRGAAEDLPLDRWFNEGIWMLESGLTPDDVYWGTALAACEMIRSGCAGFNDLYFFMDRAAEVVEQSGLKAALAWNMFGLGTDKEPTLERALAFAARWAGRADGRIRVYLGPHSPYICPPAMLRDVAAAAKDHGLPLHIHLAESQEQVDNSLARHGLSPAAYLEAAGVLDVPCVAAHVLYASDDDVATLARHGASVAHCPITYMKLSMGVNDLGRLLRAGITVGLGTDGTGSNNDMDMKAVVRIAALLQKHATRDAEALAGDLPLRLATQHGARATGFPESGVLAPGRPADVTLFDFDQPHLYPRHNLVANLVHAARASDVRYVIVDGRVLLRDGELLTLDEEKIQAEAERHARRMAGQATTRMVEYRG